LCFPSLIAHYSKFVSPTHATFVWICFKFLFPSLKTHQNELWMSENEKRKRKKKKTFLSYGNRVMVAFL